MAKSEIKTIIQPPRDCYAGFLPDTPHSIDLKIVPIVCWSLVTFDNDDEPDEVIGQIVARDAVVEVTYVDEEEGFGKFLGYFYSEQSAKVAILAAVAEGLDDEEDPNSEAAESPEDREPDDDDEDDDYDDDEDDDEDDDDEDDDEDDEDDE